MLKTISEFIQKNNLFDSYETIGVAVSGGIDSMVMLDILLKLGYRVRVLHFEHGIRGEESKRDAMFVKQHCSENNIDVDVTCGDVLQYSEKNGLSVETAARILRYQYFESSDTDVVAVAHHMDDQTETVFQHIIRGSGIKGLMGMLPVNGKIVRPLLCISKKDIEEYAEVNHINHVEDRTNNDTAYTRNKIRKEIIPLLKDINPKINDAVERLSESAKGAFRLIEECSEDVPYDIVDGEAVISFSKLKALPHVVAQYIIYKMFCDVGQEIDIEAKHIDDIFRLEHTGAVKQIKNGFYAKKEYDQLIISNKQLTEKADFSVEFSDGVRFPGGKLNIVAKNFNADNKDRHTESFSFIPSGAVIRNKRPGDMFKVFGGKKKKLVDYMTDVKIPLTQRDSVPLLAFGNDIIWVIGYSISADYAVKDNNYLTIKFIEENTNG